MITRGNSGLDLLLSTKTFSNVRACGIRKIIINKRRKGFKRELVQTWEMSTGISNI